MGADSALKAGPVNWRPLGTDLAKTKAHGPSSATVLVQATLEYRGESVGGTDQQQQPPAEREATPLPRLVHFALSFEKCQVVRGHKLRTIIWSYKTYYETKIFLVREIYFHI